MRVTQLFEDARKLPPGDQVGYISERLDEALIDSRISIWRRGEPVQRTGHWILLGIAPYSLPDLQLVDELREGLKQGSRSDESFQVFDVLSCSTMNDFDECIPGIGSVYQTPVLGIWENGVLVEKATGAKARQLVIERCGLKR